MLDSDLVLDLLTMTGDYPAVQFIYVSNASQLFCRCLSKTSLQPSNNLLKWKLFMVWMVPQLVGFALRRPMFL